MIQKFIHVFELASVVAIVFISSSAALSTGLLIVTIVRMVKADENAIDSFLLTRQKDNLTLFAALFLLFLSTVSYILITYRNLNGGHYVYGIWALTYTCMLGLICALISAIISMDDAVQHNLEHHYELGEHTASGWNGIETAKSRRNINVNGIEMSSTTAPYQFQASQV